MPGRGGGICGKRAAGLAGVHFTPFLPSHSHLLSHSHTLPFPSIPLLSSTLHHTVTMRFTLPTIALFAAASASSVLALSTPHDGLLERRQNTTTGGSGGSSAAGRVVAPLAPGPGDVFRAGQTCGITWAPATSARWRSMTISRECCFVVWWISVGGGDARMSSSYRCCVRDPRPSRPASLRFRQLDARCLCKATDTAQCDR